MLMEVSLRPPVHMKEDADEGKTHSHAAAATTNTAASSSPNRTKARPLQVHVSEETTRRLHSAQSQEEMLSLLSEKNQAFGMQ